MLRRYPTEIEADLQRYYQTHLGHLGSRRLTYRRLSVLLRHMPDDSAFMQAYIADQPINPAPIVDATQWPLDARLLGHILDSVNMGNWQRGGGKGPRPESVLEAPRRSLPPVPGIDVREVLSRGAPTRPNE